ncbi:MAG: ABC transporter permease [Gammaproteobacteria bacterium]
MFRLSPLYKVRPYYPNYWDLIAIVLVLALIVAITSAARQMSAPFELGQSIEISLDPANLPAYTVQTLLRMSIALIFSLLFTFIFATWAAKSPRAEKLIIPLIDILQSIPVLAFLSITIVGFIALFPNSLWGPQCAVIFLIFTAQAWNMALSFYQSLRTLPAEFKDAADMFHLSAWQRFWRIEVPFAVPGLLWNAMMSMSASWFALVASEAISVSSQTINLPGIGSYIAAAIKAADLSAVGYAVLAMFIAIICYDQLLFRPLVKWAEKFKAEQNASERVPHSLLVTLLERTRILRYIGYWVERGTDVFINVRWFRTKPQQTYRHRFDAKTEKIIDWGWNGFMLIAVIIASIALGNFILTYLSLPDVLHVASLGIITAVRVAVLIVLCSLIWVPIGVWVGLRPNVAEFVQPIAQFLAAFPANLLFPFVVVLIVTYKLNVNVWTTPLMILGAQWYILFNVIAGTSAIPKELKQVSENFGLRGWLWWRRLILPAIFPYYITGAITASGGAWNASLVAEVVTWGDTTLEAAGLGAYITEHTGSFPQTALGVSVMCIFVLSINRLIWRPLYRMASSRFQLV